jgi:hypothetical protein
MLIVAALASVSPGAVMYRQSRAVQTARALPAADEVAVAGELVPTYDRAPHESPPVAPPADLAATHGPTMLQPVCS